MIKFTLDEAIFVIHPSLRDQTDTFSISTLKVELGELQEVEEDKTDHKEDIASRLINYHFLNALQIMSIQILICNSNQSSLYIIDIKQKF